MTRAGRAYAAAAAALVLALSAACSSSPQPAAPREAAPIQDGWQGCQRAGAFADPESDAPTPPSGGVPSGFTATSVVLCVAETGVDADADVVVLRGTERTSTEVGPLLTYLAQPDELPTDGTCTADGWVAPWMVLVDDRDRFVVPAIPVDGCGKPLGWYDQGTRPAWEVPRYTDRVIRTR